MNHKKELRRKAKKLWIEVSLAKWGNICLVCGDVAIQFHHFIPKGRNGLLRYEWRNSVPMCQKCHYSIHFSPSPSVIHRIIETIRTKRGKVWRDWIDEHEKIHGKNFSNIKWLEDKIIELEGI